MSPDRLAALRSFFTTIEPKLLDAVALVYSRLFEAVPQAASLFKGNIQEQQRLFTLMLQSIIKLTRSSHLWPVSAFTGQASVPALDQLRMRHADAGVIPEHFEIMKKVMADCCREMFPKDFTPTVEEALGFIFDVMSRSLTESNEAGSAQFAQKNHLPVWDTGSVGGDPHSYFADAIPDEEEDAGCAVFRGI